MVASGAPESNMRKKKDKNAVVGTIEIPEDPFDCIRGYKEEVARLKSVAAAVRDIVTGNVRFGQLPAGIMLSGDPGMGKTTMARAFAKATGLACVGTNAPLSLDIIHELYETAKTVAPAVILIDDVDKILPEETTLGDTGYASDESRAALKELISQLDGLVKADKVITVMTTNAYSAIDDALKRPGRVDVHIPIGLPTDEDRRDILSYYMGQYGGAFDKSLVDVVTKKTYALSCSALRTIVNDVWLQNYNAYSNGAGAAVNWADCFQRRILEFRGDGLLKRSVSNEDDYWRICYHEAGHAVVEYYLTKTTSDVCVLQVSGSDAGGWTFAREDDGTKKMWGEEECKSEIAVALAGMAAEMEKYGKHSLGASSDIAHARGIVSEMMFCDVPYSNFENAVPLTPGIHFTEPTTMTVKAKMDLRVNFSAMLSEGVETARKTIAAHRERFEALARHLHDYGTASGETVEQILKE